MSQDEANVDEIFSRWKKSFPAADDFHKKVAATMLEAEAKRLREESENRGKPWMKPGWNEEEPSIVDRVAGLDDPIAQKRCDDWDEWVKAGKPRPGFNFPGIRRSHVQQISTPIVSAQPMTQPVGGIAFYRQKYGVKTGKV